MSGYFTTAATAVGTDQQVSYTQTHDAIATRVIAACSGFEGVAPGYLNELSATATAANTVRVDTGGAIVDGKWFVNDAAQDVTIASAGAGLTRIDRIVLRCNWAAWNVSVYTVTGTDHATPTAPTITQTSGTTYDILLWQALVNDAGAVTLTDERTWAGAGAIYRQGGHATNWYAPGTTNYIIGDSFVQIGVADITIANGQSTGTVVVTYPLAFSGTTSWVIANLFETLTPSEVLSVQTEIGYNSGVTIRMRRAGTSGAITYAVGWIAIGQR